MKSVLSGRFLYGVGFLSVLPLLMAPENPICPTCPLSASWKDSLDAGTTATYTTELDAGIYWVELIGDASLSISGGETSCDEVGCQVSLAETSEIWFQVQAGRISTDIELMLFFLDDY